MATAVTPPTGTTDAAIAQMQQAAENNAKLQAATSETTSRMNADKAAAEMHQKASEVRIR